MRVYDLVTIDDKIFIVWYVTSAISNVCIHAKIKMFKQDRFYLNLSASLSSMKFAMKFKKARFSIFTFYLS